jgi:diphosphomevalonate decarboxylase
MSCLVTVLSKLFNVKRDQNFLSHLARLGSGSACRSMHGGIVEWHRKDEETGLSIAKQIVDENYWDLTVLLFIVSDRRKDIGSTDGMKISKETSLFFNVNLVDLGKS